MQKVVQLLRLMRFIKRIPPRLTCMLLILTSFISLTANGQDFQNGKVNLKLKSASLKEAFADIQKQSGVRFIYDQDIKKYDALKITQSVKDITVKKAVELILKSTNLQYVPEGSHVMISEKPARKPASVNPNAAAGQGQGTGGLKGRVVEFETSQPLPGATVQIIELNRGITTDSSGYYRFTGIRAGKYTLKVSFVSYTTENQPVEVKANREEVYDIKLQGNNQLGEVVITASGKIRRPVAHTSEKQVLQEIKGAKSVVSGISSEQIGKSADRNAAEAVRKISGISVKDDKFIIIRGLNERYNLTYLNDNVAPSTELYSRAFALDLLPTRIIDKILVYKSPAPDLLADMTGGAVKIFTKDAKAVKHFDIEVQAGYRPHTTFNKNFMTYQGGKWDFLGFDDGTRKLPSTVPGYGDFTKATIGQQTYAETFNPTLQYGYMRGLPLLQLTANYYNRFKIAGKPLSLLGSLSYKNESQQNEVSRMQSSFNTSRKHNIIDEVQSQQTAQITWLQNFTYRLRDSSTVQFKNFLLLQGQSGVVDRTQYNNRQFGYYTDGNGKNQGIGDNSTGWYDFQQTATDNRNIILNYTQRFLYSGNLAGTHYVGSSGKQSLQWNAGYIYSRQDIPDQRLSRFNRGSREYLSYLPSGNPLLEWSASVRPMNYGAAESQTNDVERGIISRTWARNIERSYNFSADYTWRWRPWATFRAGTYQQWKERELFRRVYTVNEGDLNSGGYPNNALIGADGRYMDYNLVFFKEQDLGKVWSNTYLRDDGSALKVYDRTSGSDAYTATEQNNSGYVAVSLLPYDSKLDIYGGLRVEYDRQKVAGAIPQGQQTSPIEGGINTPVLVDIKKLNWLPSINIGYRPSSQWVLRGSYGKTVNRPEFRELSPYSELDYFNNQVIYGNSLLQPASVDNYDLRIEWYPGDAARANTISLGGFHKKLTNPIERVLFRDLNYNGPTYITFDNAATGTITGVELDLRQQLDIIPGAFFRNLSIIANGTFIQSEVNKMQSDGNGANTFAYKRRMQGQAPYLFNAGLYYDNAGSGTKAAVIFNYIGPRIYAAASGVSYDTLSSSGNNYRNGGYAGSLLELPRGQLDISVTQRIVKSLQAKFSVQNLLNRPVQMAEDENFTYKYEKAVYSPLVNGSDVSDNQTKGDPLASSYKPYPYFNLTITYSF